MVEAIGSLQLGGSEMRLQVTPPKLARWNIAVRSSVRVRLRETAPVHSFGTPFCQFPRVTNSANITQQGQPPTSDHGDAFPCPAGRR